MKLGIMQPYFFPYLGYWQLINAVDKYVVYDDVTYIKGGWINRNNILLNNSSHLITLSLVNSSSFKNINEIEITRDSIKLEKLLKTIKVAYMKAPHYKEIMPIIEKLVRTNTNIAKLNFNSIIEINKYLNIQTEILLSSQIKKDNKLKAQDKVIHINEILGADTYYNAIGGQTLYSKEIFKEKGINLRLLKMNELRYKQFNNEFVPNLSIIDVLMFNKKETIQKYLDNFCLI